MAVYVDLICSKCGLVVADQWSDKVGTVHVTSVEDDSCGGIMERLWTMTPAPNPGTHASEKVVVYQSLKEGGKIQYPGRNDVPVPARLRARGYERVEVHVPQLAAFEKRHGVKNERRHFDRNGRGFEN